MGINVSFHICKQVQEGKIVLGGALAEPVDSALFIWKDSTAEARAVTLTVQHYYLTTKVALA